MITYPSGRCQDFWRQLTTAEGGFRHLTAAALNLLEKNPVDVALIDIRMPIMDGLEMCRRIRKVLDKIWQQLPGTQLSQAGCPGPADRADCISSNPLLCPQLQFLTWENPVGVTGGKVSAG